MGGANCKHITVSKKKYATFKWDFTLKKLVKKHIYVLLHVQLLSENIVWWPAMQKQIVQGCVSFIAEACLNHATLREPE